MTLRLNKSNVTTTGWINGDSTYDVLVDAGDRGLGLRRLTLTSDLNWRSGDYLPCETTAWLAHPGDRNHRCPLSVKQPFLIDTMPEGVNTVVPEAYDAVGLWASRKELVARIDRTAPSIDTPTGTLWDRRNRGDDRRFQGLYEQSYSLDVTARDGSTTSNATKRSGVKAVDVKVKNAAGTVVVDSPDPSPQSCAASSCTKPRTFTLNTDTLTDGDYTIEVTATDQVGNTTTPTKWTVTVDRRGDIFAAERVSGNPTAGGQSFGREWGRLSTTEARHDDGHLLSTRTTAPCDDEDPTGAQCGEVRQRPIGEDGQLTGDISTYRSSDPDDPRLEAVSDMLAVADHDYGAADATGPLNDIVATWQGPPPTSGAQYARHDFSGEEQRAPGASSDQVDESQDFDEADNAEQLVPLRSSLWVDTTTRLPVRATVTYDDGTARTVHWSYDRSRLERSQVAADFFRQERPSNADGETSVEMTGNERVGPHEDRQTRATFQPLYLGPTFVMRTGTFCLASGVRFFQRDPAPTGAADPDPGETALDLSTISAVEAIYNRVSDGAACSPGNGLLDDAELELDMYHRQSDMATELRERFTEIATAVQLDPSDGHFGRGGLQPVLVGLESVNAYVVPLSPQETSALVEIGDVTMVLTGVFEKQDLNTLVSELEKM